MASGKPWTGEEMQYLRDNRTDRVKDIAKVLGRTPQSVAYKRREMRATKPRNQYEVYRGYELIASGTMEECAEKLGVTPFYIRWMTYPSAQKRLTQENRKVIAFKLDDDELEEMEHEQLEG